jgi:hypothetical protein
MSCERCGRRAPWRRYRCQICKRLVCFDCRERMDEPRKVWCRLRDDLGNNLPDDCRDSA